jgi:hypothetical protein
METRGNNKLKSLLKSYEIKTPPPAFTDEVVREIEAMSDDKVYASGILKGMLQKNVVHSPSTEFTYKVLNKAREQSTASYPPIIGKRAWALIAAFVVVCVIVAFIKAPSVEANSLLPDLSLGEFLSKVTLTFVEPLFYSAVILASATLLLAMDYFITKWRRTRRSA